MSSCTFGMIGIGVTSTSMQLLPPPSPPPPPVDGPGSMPPPPAPVSPPVPLPPMQRPLVAQGAPAHSGALVTPATHSAWQVWSSVSQNKPCAHSLSDEEHDSPQPVTPAMSQGPPVPPPVPPKLGEPLQAGEAMSNAPRGTAAMPMARRRGREGM